MDWMTGWGDYAAAATLITAGMTADQWLSSIEPSIKAAMLIGGLALLIARLCVTMVDLYAKIRAAIRGDKCRDCGEP